MPVNVSFIFGKQRLNSLSGTTGHVTETHGHDGLGMVSCMDVTDMNVYVSRFYFVLFHLQALYGGSEPGNNVFDVRQCGLWDT